MVLGIGVALRVLDQLKVPAEQQLRMISRWWQGRVMRASWSACMGRKVEESLGSAFWQQFQIQILTSGKGKPENQETAKRET